MEWATMSNRTSRSSFPCRSIIFCRTNSFFSRMKSCRRRAFSTLSRRQSYANWKQVKWSSP
jgi:hypothetical protein